MKKLGLILVLCLLLSACGGGKPIDWNDRIGVYTYEQAQKDYGTATGQQELSTGSTMYVWYDWGAQKWHNVLALVFGPDGTLESIERDERD